MADSTQDFDMDIPEPELEFGDPTPADARARSRRSAGARSRKRPRPDPLPAEREKVEAFVEKIDITDTASVLSYGVGSQRKVSEFSERALTGVRNNDLGEIGDDISSLIVTLKDFDPDKQEKSGPLAIFHKAKNSLEALRTRYTAVEKNVREISDTLEGHQRTLLKDIATLDQLYALNEAYFKELTMYVVAGKEKLEQVRGRRACPAPGQGCAIGPCRGRPGGARPGPEVRPLREAHLRP
jgi:uncharacterized protein YaaN involved in tellurite resistance